MWLVPHRPLEQKKTKKSTRYHLLFTAPKSILDKHNNCRTVASSHFWWTGLRVGRKTGIVPCFPPSRLPLGTLAARRPELISGNSKTLSMVEVAAPGPWWLIWLCWRTPRTGSIIPFLLCPSLRRGWMVLLLKEAKCPNAPSSHGSH